MHSGPFGESAQVKKNILLSVFLAYSSVSNAHLLGERIACKSSYIRTP